MKRGRPAGERTTYLDIIDADRRSEREHAAAPKTGGARKSVPPRARRDYPRREELQRDLARYYERCKSENVGRFGPKRLKGYCSAVSWTVARRAGRYPDYPWPPKAKETVTMARRTPPRNSRGRFMKRGHARAAAPRRGRMSNGGGGRVVIVREAAPRRARSPRRHGVKGYRYTRRGRSVAVRPHYSRETRRARRRGRARENMVIVPARSPRRRFPRRGRGREMFAYDAPRAGIGGLVLLGTGVIVGATAADFLHRWATTNATTATGVTLPTGVASITALNQIAPLKLTGTSAMYQLGLAAVGILAGAFLPWAPVRMFSYGVGIGALGHLGVQILNQYVIEPMMSVGTANVTANGQRYFGAENAAIPLLAAATTTGTTTSGTSSGMAGQRPGLAAAAPAGLPAGQPRERVPATLGAALAPGAGQGNRVYQPPFGRVPFPAGQGQQPGTGIMVPGQPQQPVGVTQVPTAGGTQPAQPIGVTQPAQPPGQTQPAPPPGQTQQPGGPPPPSFGPPGTQNGGQQPPSHAPGGGPGCAACAPDCTGCVKCRMRAMGNGVGEPPPPGKRQPHPLFAALRAA